MNVSFLGLGVMGYPMAGHLARAGHKVTVYNRSGAKAEKWTNEFGGALAATPKEAAIGQEIVFACVGNDDDVRSITLGEAGAFAGMSEGSLFVDHTTASADVARELCGTARETQRGLHGCTGLGRTTGRRERCLNSDGRREPSAFRPRFTGHQCLRACLYLDG